MAKAKPQTRSVVEFYESLRGRARLPDHVEVLVDSRARVCGCCRKRIRPGIPFFYDGLLAQLVGGNMKLCVACMKAAAQAQEL
jgi:hypothetical protein